MKFDFQFAGLAMIVLLVINLGKHTPILFLEEVVIAIIVSIVLKTIKEKLNK
jgi:hypothetical protein